jgi:hypothetical protein
MNTPTRSRAQVDLDLYAEGYENGALRAEAGLPAVRLDVDEDPAYAVGYAAGYLAEAVA